MNDKPPFIEVDPFKIDFNPENPRGEHVGETDKHLWPLVESVREFGVLVPVLVRPLEDDEYEYELIDGERRLLAARRAGLPKVPALVIYAEVDDETTRKTMFHIHRYRESWGPLAECESVRPLYRELLGRYHSPDAPALLEEFVDRTGYYKRTAQDRLRFLRWPEDVTAQVYAGAAPYWFVIEVESKIIEPGKKNFPEYINDATVNGIRRSLFQKYLNKVVGAAVSVREAGIIARTSVPEDRKSEARAVLTRLVNEPDLSFEQARELYLRRFPDALVAPRRGPVALLNEVERLTDELADYDEQYILKGVGRSKVDVQSFVHALQHLSGVLGQLVQRLQGAESLVDAKGPSNESAAGD